MQQSKSTLVMLVACTGLSSMAIASTDSKRKSVVMDDSYFDLRRRRGNNKAQWKQEIANRRKR